MSAQTVEFKISAKSDPDPNGTRCKAHQTIEKTQAYALAGKGGTLSGQAARPSPRKVLRKSYCNVRAKGK